MNEIPAPQSPAETETPGPEEWVPEAIAEQEEHIKRSRPCGGPEGRPHAFRAFGRPSPDGTILNARMWRACFNCGVTETPADYATKTAP